MKVTRLAVRMSLLGVLIAALLGVRVVSSADWDPTVFTAFGEEAVGINEYAEEKLGRQVLKRAGQGHDGKFFFVQANDPWLLAPEDNVAVIDRPLYRSQRMLYPILAGGSGFFSPETIAWSLLVINLLAMGAGTWAVSVIASELGGSPWWGMAFVLNVGFISEMNIDGSGVVAAAAAFGAVAMIMRGHIGWGIALLTVAALSREAMLIAAAGTGVWLWHIGLRKDAGLALGVPIASVGLWATYIRIRIGWDAGVSEIQEIGLPFVGIVDSFSGWLDRPLNLVAGIALLVLFVVFSRRAIVSRHLVGWAFVGFVPLGLLFTQQVWQSYFDITRAVAPIITTFVLLMFLNQESVGEQIRVGTV